MYTRENPSQRYTELLAQYQDMHRNGLPDMGIEPEKLFDGASLLRHLPTIRELVASTGASTLLDYGSGKGTFYQMRDFTLPKGPKIPSIAQYLGVNGVHCYDPAVPEFQALPEGKFDGVISTDALEHCPQDDIDWIVEEMFAYSGSFVFANVASYPARKSLPNGENAHATQQSASWWRDRLSKISARHPGVQYHFEITEIRASFRTLFREKKQAVILSNT